MVCPLLGTNELLNKFAKRSKIWKHITDNLSSFKEVFDILGLKGKRKKRNNKRGFRSDAMINCLQNNIHVNVKEHIFEENGFKIISVNDREKASY